MLNRRSLPAGCHATSGRIRCEPWPDAGEYANIGAWDDDEIYPTLEVFRGSFHNVTFEKKFILLGSLLLYKMSKFPGIFIVSIFQKVL